MMSAERLLIAIFLSLYLLDCLVFLKPTQGIVFLRRQGVRLAFGVSSYSLRGKVPALLNPFTPWILGFKTRPVVLENDDAAIAFSAGTIQLRRLRRPRALVLSAAPLLVCQGLLLFGALPFFLVTARHNQFFVGLACAFLSAAAIAGMGLQLIRPLGLSKRSCWALCLQAFICLPLSLNLLRKIALLASVRDSALDLLPRVAADQRPAAALELRFALEANGSGVVDDPKMKKRAAEIQKQIDDSAA